MIRVGHATLGDTGCTVIACPEGALAAVDVRGGGPGTRETDLLESYNTVELVHAIVLSGGSAFGLAAADGVMLGLEARGIGFPVVEGGPVVPIVPAAVIFDLFVGSPTHRPTLVDGQSALDAALASGGSVEVGSVGAGTAATAGRISGGFGTATVTADGYEVTAYMVANPMGEVIDPTTHCLWDTDLKVDYERFLQLTPPRPKLNTTIGWVTTTAPVTHGQLKRLAMVAHDGLARAIRPAHSPLDGDTIFALADPVAVSAEATAPSHVEATAPSHVEATAPSHVEATAPSHVEAPGLDMVALCAASAEATQQAIQCAITHAAGTHGRLSFSDLAL